MKKRKLITRGLCLAMAILMVLSMVLSVLPLGVHASDTNTNLNSYEIEMSMVRDYPQITFYDNDREVIEVDGKKTFSISDKKLSFDQHTMYYETSKDDFKCQYAYVDLVVAYADKQYNLNGANPYGSFPDTESAVAILSYGESEHWSDLIEFSTGKTEEGGEYLIIKAHFNEFNDFNEIDNIISTNLRYTRPAKGDSVPIRAFGSDDYKISKLIVKEEEDDEIPDDGLIGDLLPDGGAGTPETPAPVITGSTPYVIVEEFSFAGGSNQVAAGSSFGLNLICRNTHNKVDLENIIMKITAADGLQLTNSSNTFYLSRLKKNASFEKDLNISALSTAEAKSYNITVAFTYEYVADGARQKGEMTQDISIPVVQQDRFSADPITNVADVTIGDEIDILSKYMNKSRGELYNVVATLDCDPSILCEEKIIHGGNMASGLSGEVEFTLNGTVPGTYPCTVTYTYEDALGIAKETRVDFEVTFIEPPVYEWDQPIVDMPVDDGIIYDEFGNPIDPMAQPEGLTQNQKLLIGGGAAAVVVLVLLILRKRKKKKEFEDDDENF